MNSKCLLSHVGIFVSPTLKSERLMCIQLDRVGLQNSSSRAPLLLTFPLLNLMQVCELQVLVVGVSLGRVSVTNSRSFIPPAMFDLRPFRFRVDGRGGAGKPHPPPSLLLTISGGQIQRFTCEVLSTRSPKSRLFSSGHVIRDVVNISALH